MKTQLIKLKKSDGYIAIETVIIASLAIAAGFISLRTILGDLRDTAVSVNAQLSTAFDLAFEIN